MKLNTEHIANAFRKAHHASQNDSYSPEAREKFREIANEIWYAAGQSVDPYADVYSWARTAEEAEEIARMANATGATRGDRFVAGSFRVAYPDGRMPAVVGDLVELP
jgi:hypothetical protein